ncbi:putative integral membrane protein [Theileria parva strain Muguga]|uniref:Uncharacterized protein n=1 Tax=Theileria parva TaxID=5875 RepID=Q4N7M4_THEPA|nr:putative integral membrane protein [Theileria parva strain Muguga]EAN34034.1 putative integral membrane protein [Theileria parva strain Muguga]|eukprot:XP_766317.1 hypothetical protein [Theileria parva strain Muguga]
MNLNNFTSIRKKIFSPTGLCIAFISGYMYMLMEYVKLEYRVYKEKRQIIKDDSDPTKLNLLFIEHLAQKKK